MASNLSNGPPRLPMENTSRPRLISSRAAKPRKSTNRVSKRTSVVISHEHGGVIIDRRHKRAWKACQRCRLKKTKVRPDTSDMRSSNLIAYSAMNNRLAKDVRTMAWSVPRATRRELSSNQSQKGELPHSLSSASTEKAAQSYPSFQFMVNSIVLIYSC